MAVRLFDLDFVGEEVALRITKGQRLSVTFQIVDDSGTGMDITGRVYAGYIGLPGDVALVTFSQTANDAEHGLVDLTLTAMVTNTLEAGAYKWIVWEDDIPILRGDVEVVAPIVTAS